MQWFALLALSLADPVAVRFEIDSNGTWTVPVNIGSPPTEVQMTLDFAVGDFLVMMNDDVCGSLTCSNFRPANQSVVTSVKYGNNTEDMEFMHRFTDSVLASDGTPISGLYQSGRVEFGGVSLDDAVIMLHNASNTFNSPNSDGSSLTESLNVSTWGLGPQGLQSTVAWLEDGIPAPVYDGILEKLQNKFPELQRGYSVWVDPITQAYGYLILGGTAPELFDGSNTTTIDISNLGSFYGTLTSPGAIELLTQPEYLAIPIRYAMVHQDFNPDTNDFIDIYTPESNQYSPGALAIFNSHAGLGLPESLLNSVASVLNAEYSPEFQLWLYPCGIGETTLTFDDYFWTSGLLVDIALQTPWKDALENPICAINAEVTDQIYLPNSALRQFYWTVDYDTNKVMFGSPLVSTKQDPSQLNMDPIDQANPYQIDETTTVTTDLNLQWSTSVNYGQWQPDMHGNIIEPMSLGPAEAVSLGLMTLPTIRPRTR